MRIRVFWASVGVALLVTTQSVMAAGFGPGVARDNPTRVSWQQEDLAPEALDATCGDGLCMSDACCPWGCRTSSWQVFGELLFLRARDAEVAYAVAIDGAIEDPTGPAPVQIGPVGLVDPDYEPGFRIGFGRALADCANLSASYTHYESNTVGFVTTESPNVLASLVVHPGSETAASTFLDSSAEYGIDFRLVDLDYRRIISCGELHSMNYLVGLRYAHLDQDFYNLSSVLGSQWIDTGIRFDGGGIRLGLEGERHAPDSGLMVYGKAAASFVAGDFRAAYLQGTEFDPDVVNTSWKAGRIVTMLDLELGVGWTSPCDRWRLTTGYTVSSWIDAVKTNEWIDAVQNNNFVGLGDKLTFDGLVLRAEVRF